jgi:hypothetical protein
MIWGFCYLGIFKKMHSISGRSHGSSSTFYPDAKLGLTLSDVKVTNASRLMGFFIHELNYRNQFWLLAAYLFGFNLSIQGNQP